MRGWKECSRRCALHILDNLSVVCHRAFPLQNRVSGQYVRFKHIFQYGVVHFSLTTLSNVWLSPLLHFSLPLYSSHASFDLHVRLSLGSERVQLRPWLFWENSAVVVPTTCFKTAYLTHRANRTKPNKSDSCSWLWQMSSDLEFWIIIYMHLTDAFVQSESHWI